MGSDTCTFSTACTPTFHAQPPSVLRGLRCGYRYIPGTRATLPCLIPPTVPPCCQMAQILNGENPILLLLLEPLFFLL